jgi:hypothetical protein
MALYAINSGIKIYLLIVRRFGSFIYCHGELAQAFTLENQERYDSFCFVSFSFSFHESTSLGLRYPLLHDFCLPKHRCLETIECLRVLYALHIMSNICSSIGK